MHRDMSGNGRRSVTIAGTQTSLIYMASHYLCNAYMSVDWNGTHARASFNTWRHNAYYFVCVQILLNNAQSFIKYTTDHCHLYHGKNPPFRSLLYMLVKTARNFLLLLGYIDCHENKRASQLEVPMVNNCFSLLFCVVF